MSIRIKIGSIEHDLAQADEHWVISQIKDQQRDSGNVCVQVSVKGQDVDLNLRSAGCAPLGGGVGRQATPKEQQILELWNRHGGQNGHLGGGEIVAFLKQLQRMF